MWISEGSKWIWARNCQYNENCYCEFVENFTVYEHADTVSVRISADSKFAIWINGGFAGSGQYPDYPEYKVFDTVDITKHVRPGANEMRVLVYYQGTDTSTYRRGEAGVIFDIIADRDVLAISGASTRSRVAYEYRNGPMELISPQLGYTFEYNASATAKTNEYKWQSSRIVNGPHKLYARPIPRLVLKDRTPSKITAQGYFMLHPAYSDACTAEIMQRAFLSSAEISDITGHPTEAPYVLNGSSPLRCCIDSASTKHLGENGVYLLIDIGKEDVGFFDIDIEAANGTVIYIGYGEHTDDLRVRTRIGPRSFAAKYTCKGGRNKFTHYFTRFGCRYISLYIQSFNFTLHYAGLRPCEYPFEDKGSFKCSDSLHNKIYDTCVRTLRLSAHDHYEDCPWREQALYAMDSRNQMLCGYYAFGEYDMPRESIRLLALGIREDGLLELCAPARCGVVIPSFSLMWIIELYEYVLYSGDAEFAREMWPYAESIIRAFWRSSKGGDLPTAMNSQPYWNFYEWSHGLSDGYPAHLRDKNNIKNYDGVLSALYILALSDAIKIAKLLYSRFPSVHAHAQPKGTSGALSSDTDFSGKISWCEMLHAAAVSAFHDTFWDENTKAYCSYVVNGDKVHFAELTNALALYAGLVPEVHISRVADILSGKDICVPSLIPVTLSYSIFKYEALLSSGDEYADYVFNDIAEKWGCMLFKGATSFWETEDGPWAFSNAGSLCHGWSAVPALIYYKYLLGVSPSKYGFADYSFKPAKLRTLITASGTIPRIGQTPLHAEITKNGFKLS